MLLVVLDSAISQVPISTQPFFLSLINQYIFLFYTQTYAPLSIYNCCPQREAHVEKYVPCDKLRKIDKCCLSENYQFQFQYLRAASAFNKIK